MTSPLVTSTKLIKDSFDSSISTKIKLFKSIDGT
jgi:hypothetical protein